MKRALQAAALIAIGIAAIGGPILYKLWRGAIERNRPNLAAEPFRIAGNLYYIGTSYTTVLLLAGPAGHVVLDGGDREVDFVMASIAKLGFDIKDVKMLLNSDPRAAGGLAEIQRASGAALWSNARGAGVIASGGRDPDNRLPMRILVGIGALSYTPARVDHVFTDGETLRLGPIALTAHVTSGVSRGCTSWSFPVRDGDRVLNVVAACSLIRVGGQRYRGQETDLEQSFEILRRLPADIWVTSSSRLWGRYRKFVASKGLKDPADAFVDPAGYRAYISDAEDELRRDVVH